ncbi:MAG: TRAP transporter large permease subunit [Thiotrichaceae bacterium]|nr:TRAP transporter large permease subunit [Thiotrichaceae bacterium]
MIEWMPFLLFLTVIIVLMLGYPVAFTLAGVALIFAGIGTLTHTFDPILGAMPERINGIMTNPILLAVPLFVFMGIILEKSKLAENLLDTMAQLFGQLRGGLGFSVIIVGMLLAASTGIVGATVVTMGLLSLPIMLKRGYQPEISCGLICASGTLGQIIPPSIILVLLGDQLSSAYQQAQLNQGIFSPEQISVGDLFAGAIIPGLLLVSLYISYLAWVAWRKPESMPAPPHAQNEKLPLVKIFNVLLPPLFLILAVLGSILIGWATPTEAASVGAVGALLLAYFNQQLSLATLKSSMLETVKVSSMVFMILIAASLFSLVFRGFGGDDQIHQLLANLPGGKWTAIIIVMLVMFLLGFVLDFIEITFVVVPIVAPVLLMMDIDPIWLGIMIAINLQTSFLTPPFGFALFYLRGVAPKVIKTSQIYRGVIPFIIIQVFALLILALFPELITWLPNLLDIR